MVFARRGLLGRTAKHKNVRFGQDRFNENVQCVSTVAGHGANLRLMIGPGKTDRTGTI